MLPEHFGEIHLQQDGASLGEIGWEQAAVFLGVFFYYGELVLHGKGVPEMADAS
jgi:hypothetical protein